MQSVKQAVAKICPSCRRQYDLDEGWSVCPEDGAQLCTLEFAAETAEGSSSQRSQAKMTPVNAITIALLFLIPVFTTCLALYFNEHPPKGFVAMPLPASPVVPQEETISTFHGDSGTNGGTVEATTRSTTSGRKFVRFPVQADQANSSPQEP